MNNHYNGTFLEPWGERARAATASRCSSGSCAKWPSSNSAARPQRRPARLEAARRLAYNDLSADRQTVAAVQAMEAILARHAAGMPDAVAYVNHQAGGLVLFSPGNNAAEVLYADRV